MQEHKRLQEMSKDELIEIIHDMRWSALDLAQHLVFTVDLLKPKYQKEAYKRATAMAYQLAFPPDDKPTKHPEKFDINFFTADGLHKISPDEQ